MTAPEFSRTVRVDTLGEAPRTITVEAGESERRALARRFGFVAIARLSADLALARVGGDIAVRGIVRAALVQSCIASGEPVAEEVEEALAATFRTHPPVGSAEVEIELGEDELDVIFFGGGLVDVGEAVAETLSLAVDPFPRSPAAEEALREAGVRSGEDARLEASPFAALKDKLR